MLNLKSLIHGSISNHVNLSNPFDVILCLRWPLGQNELGCAVASLTSVAGMTRYVTTNCSLGPDPTSQTCHTTLGNPVIDYVPIKNCTTKNE